LSHLLTKTGRGFKMKQNETFRHNTSHLLYMDDLKLYASTDHQLKQLVSVTEAFSIDTKYYLVLINVKLDVYTEKNVRSTGSNYSIVVLYHPTRVQGRYTKTSCVNNSNSQTKQHPTAILGLLMSVH